MTPHDKMKESLRESLLGRAKEYAKGYALKYFLGLEAKYELQELIVRCSEMTREAAIRECAEIALEHIQCADPYHDERWCLRCSTMEDAGYVIEKKILSLLNEPSAKPKKEME